MKWLHQCIGKHKRTKLLSSDAKQCAKSLDEMLSGYMGALKIVTTPIPFPYLHMLSMLSHVYCFTVPFYFAAKVR